MLSPANTEGKGDKVCHRGFVCTMQYSCCLIVSTLQRGNTELTLQRHQADENERPMAAHRTRSGGSDNWRCIENIPGRWTRMAAGASEAALPRWSVGKINDHHQPSYGAGQRAEPGGRDAIRWQMCRTPAAR